MKISSPQLLWWLFRCWFLENTWKERFAEYACESERGGVLILFEGFLRIVMKHPSPQTEYEVVYSLWEIVKMFVLESLTRTSKSPCKSPCTPAFLFEPSPTCCRRTATEQLLAHAEEASRRQRIVSDNLNVDPWLINLLPLIGIVIVILLLGALKRRGFVNHGSTLQLLKTRGYEGLLGSNVVSY